MSIQIHGHRGYPSRFPENSLEGFRYCVKKHLNVIETDVQRTADGIIVIIHDEQIARVTNGKGLVKDFTYEELKSFPLQNGEAIPTLDDLIKIVKGTDVHLNIEFKTSEHRYPGIEGEVQKKISQAQLEKQTMYCSFNPDSLYAVHEIAPRQELALLYNNDDLTPVRDVLAICKTLHTDRYFKDETIPQRMWTIDDPKEMRRLARLPNVVGLITNCFELAEDMVAKETDE